MGERVLVVDDDEDISRVTQLCLSLEGFEVGSAPDGATAVEVAQEFRPDVVLLDVMMPGMDGIEVVRQLRRHPSTANTAVVMVTAKSMGSDAVLALTAGADDYVTKPFDPPELVARVRAALRRTRRLVDASPLTGLPGNGEILRRLEDLVADPKPNFALAHVDLDLFKAYNDRYGFLRGDAAIRATAALLDEHVAATGTCSFLGHVGGDDFVVLLDPDAAAGFCDGFLVAFDQLAPSLYDPQDAERGYVEVDDRRGGRRRVRIMTVSIGVASTAVRPLASVGEASARAAEMKAVAKREDRSSWALDRRRT